MGAGYGVRPTTRPHKTLLHLPLVEQGVDTFGFLYPTNLPFNHPLIRLCEIGGGSETGEGGTAHVVCGVSGKALRPYYIPLYPTPNGPMAFFSIPWSCVTVTVAAALPVVRITCWSVTLKGGFCLLSERTLWSGRPQDLSLDQGRYFPAVQAAMEKAACPGCMRPHYCITH